MSIFQTIGVHSVKAFGMTNRTVLPTNFLRKFAYAPYYVTSIYQVAHSTFMAGASLYRVTRDERLGSNAIRFTRFSADGSNQEASVSFKPNSTDKNIVSCGFFNNKLFYLSDSYPYFVCQIDPANFTLAGVTCRSDNNAPYMGNYQAQMGTDAGRPVMIGETKVWRHDLTTNNSTYRDFAPSQGSVYMRNAKNTIVGSDGNYYTAGYWYEPSYTNTYPMLVKADPTTMNVTLYAFQFSSSDLSGTYFYTLAFLDGHVYIAGNSNGKPFCMVKMNASTFNIVWSRQYVFPGSYGDVSHIQFKNGVLWCCSKDYTSYIFSVNPIDGSVISGYRINGYMGNNYQGTATFDGDRFICAQTFSSQSNNYDFAINVLNLPGSSTKTLDGESVTFAPATITSNVLSPGVYGFVAATMYTMATTTTTASTVSSGVEAVYERFYTEV